MACKWLTFLLTVQLLILLVRAANYVTFPIKDTDIGDQKGPDSLYNSAVTYMIIISGKWLESQGLQVGERLSGISWRLPAFYTTAPYISLHCDNYVVILGKSRVPTNTTSTKMEDILGPDAVTCFGPASVDIQPFAFPGGYAPNNFGQELAFTKTYTYEGGDLAMYLTGSGFGQDVVIEWSSLTEGRVTSLAHDLAYYANEFNDVIPDQSPVIRFTVLPALVEKNGTLHGDPHFVGFDGSRFNFDGLDGEVFNLVSDVNFQVNGHFREMTVDDVRGTWVTRVGILVGSHVSLVFDPSFGLVVNNQHVVTRDIEFPMEDEVKVKLVNNMKKLEVDASYASGYILHVFVQTVGSNVYLNVAFSLTNEPVNPHGIIGQTALYLSAGEEANPRTSERKNAEDILEGTFRDYLVQDGITGTRFTFNRFHRLIPTGNNERRRRQAAGADNENGDDVQSDAGGSGEYVPSFPTHFRPTTRRIAKRATLY